MTRKGPLPRALPTAAGSSSAPPASRWRSSILRRCCNASRMPARRRFSDLHDAEGAFAKGFTDGGGQLVGTTRIPLAQLDFAPVLQRIKDAGPQAVFRSA